MRSRENSLLATKSNCGEIEYSPQHTALISHQNVCVISLPVCSVPPSPLPARHDCLPLALSLDTTTPGEGVMDMCRIGSARSAGGGWRSGNAMDRSSACALDPLNDDLKPSS